ncbi:MAG TPA: hypothetical protein VKR59_01770 [Terriglobales bacterium]|nr:hypothetical protein [Terriglobales bacterium]
MVVRFITPMCFFLFVTSFVTTALAAPLRQQCGAPLFECSRTDNAMVDTPLPPPPGVGTGFSGATAKPVRDTSLNSGKIVRCTDGNFVASSGALRGITFQAGAGGSAEARMWSIDHVLLNIADSDAGYSPSQFLGFEVEGLACGRLYRNNAAYSRSGGLRVGSAMFSPTNSRWDYTRTENLSPRISIVDLTNYEDQTAEPAITRVLDFSHCYTPRYAKGGTGGQITYSEFGGVAEDDTATAVASMAFSNNIGGQGTGYLLCSAVFNPGGIMAGTASMHENIYYTYDLFAREAYRTAWNGKNWKQTKIGAIDGEHTGIHNNRINRNGQFIEVTRSGQCNGTCTSTYYNMSVGGTTLWTCATCSGHEAQGYSSMFGAGGAQTFLYGETNPVPVNISDIDTRSGVFPFCVGSWVQPTLAFSNAPCKDPVTDSHISSEMDTNGDDSSGIGWVSTTVGGPRPPYVESGIGPWRNEVTIIDPSSGAIHREGHTFNSTTSSLFTLQNAIGVISADGCCFAVTTDWFGKFGRQDSTGSNACNSGVDYYRPGWTWAKRTNVLPVSNNPGNYVYGTGNGGTGSVGTPEFNQTVGGTTSDGSVTWTNLGPSNCRGDVVIYQNR